MLIQHLSFICNNSLYTLVFSSSLSQYNHSYKLLIHRVILLFLLLFPFILPVKTTGFPGHLFRSICPKNLICQPLNSHISFLSRQLSHIHLHCLLYLSVQGIFVIFRKNHTSQLSESKITASSKPMLMSMLRFRIQ